MRMLVSGATVDVQRLAKKWPNHLGHLLVPGNGNAIATMATTGLPWACDNGAFSGFDAAKFEWFLGKITGHPGCLWVACPDVVCDPIATLDMFSKWREPIIEAGQPVAFVAQDGCDKYGLPWDSFSALFIGGSTEWKLSDAVVDLVGKAKSMGKLVHMGRVNSLRRIRFAFGIGCDSVDGTSMSRFGATYIDKFCTFAAQLEDEQLKRDSRRSKMPKRVVAVLESMWDWQSMTSDAGYTELAPRSYTINPHNFTGKRLYYLVGSDAWLNVTNACLQLVRSASERGTPDPEWLAENLAQMRPFDLVLICGTVARQTYRLSSTKGARLIEMPHPAARTWTNQSLAFAARLIQEGSCDLSLTFKKKNGKHVLVAHDDIIPF